MPEAEKKPAAKKPEKKPWERDVFGVEKPRPTPTPTPAAKKERPKSVTTEASETHTDVRRRNEELVKLYGEKGSQKKAQKPRGSLRKDANKRR